MPVPATSAFELAIDTGSGTGPAPEGIKWREGVAVVFDDSFGHEVRWHASANESSAMSGRRWRLVLIVDFWHPGLSEAQRTLIGGNSPAPFGPWRGLQVCSP